MELKPHDLVRIDHTENILADQPLPEWALSALKNAPYAVIRRAVPPKGFVPIGLRGRKKNERLAVWLKSPAVGETIAPHMLVSPGQWKIKHDRLSKAVFTLQKIAPVLNDKGLYWGPTGSTAFELATGVQTTTTESDLDLLFRFNRPLPVDEGAALLDELARLSQVRLDIQLDTPPGGVSLKEYVSSPTVLVKTASGPLLIRREELWAGRQSSASPKISS